MNSKKLGIGLITIALILFAYYTISPLFRDIELHDELPQEMVESATKEAGPFTIVGTTGHPASGSVKIIETDEKRIVRFENFKTINGPNLHLYLSRDLKASDYIDLGPIRGTEGEINYTIPPDIDLSEYRYVLHWCVPFRVLFNYAEIVIQ